MTTKLSKPTKPPKAPKLDPSQISLVDIEEAMTAAGYESVRFNAKNIQIEVTGGKRDRLGNKEVMPISVHDVVLAPGMLTTDGNWPAIGVASELALSFREIQLAGTELILRDVRDLKE